MEKKTWLPLAEPAEKAFSFEDEKKVFKVPAPAAEIVSRRKIAEK
jgi:hypothetical protein